MFLSLGCSTSGGMYKKDDPENGEFSLIKTIATTAAVVGAAAILANAAKGGGGGGGGPQYARDFQPGNNQWVCRNKSNGEYADESHCGGLSYVDGWP